MIHLNRRSRIRFVPATLLALCLAATAVLLLSAHHLGTTTRVSVSDDGSQADGGSSAPAVSADSRWVAYVSTANNLVVDDTNFTADVFLHDRDTASVIRVSVASDGSQANGPSYDPSISAEGRWVAFFSTASNLVLTDTNGVADVFVHDRDSGLTERISVATGGAEANGPSMGSFYGAGPSISADGRYVAFASAASNLVPDDTNGAWDIFVHDRQLGTTTRVSLAGTGVQGNADSGAPAISADGCRVAFESRADNLVVGDMNGFQDIFLRDICLGATTRLTVGIDGLEPDDDSLAPSISNDGTRVAFTSAATNLVLGDTNGVWDVFVRDIAASATARASVATGGAQTDAHSEGARISPDGRWVGFTSLSAILSLGDTNGQPDVFLRDTHLGITHRISVATDGSLASGGSASPTLSSDATVTAFTSTASNLVAGDSNVCFPLTDGHCPDIFVRERSGAVGVSVSGRVELQGRVSHPGIGLTLSGASASATSTEPDGSFTLSDIAPGAYVLTARRPGWLCAARSVTVGSDGPVTVPTARLLAGDLNGSDAVDVFDLVFVASAYGRPAAVQPIADLNQSGVIDLADLVLVASNFGLTCPTAWETSAVAKRAPAAPPVLRLVARPTHADGTTIVDIWADGLAEAYALDLRLRVDGAKGAVPTIQPFTLAPALAAGYTLTNESTAGEARLVTTLLGPSQSLPAAGPIASVSVRGAKLTVAEVTWVDRNARHLGPQAK